MGLHITIYIYNYTLYTCIKNLLCCNDHVFTPCYMNNKQIMRKTHFVSLEKRL